MRLRCGLGIRQSEATGPMSAPGGGLTAGGVFAQSRHDRVAADPAGRLGTRGPASEAGIRTAGDPGDCHLNSRRTGIEIGIAIAVANAIAIGFCLSASV